MSWWPGDGDVTDIIDGNDGILFGGATFAPGMVGQALSLDGVDDFAYVANATSLRLQDFTIDAWIKLTGPLPGWPASLAAFGQYGYAFAIDGGIFTGGAERSLVLSKTGASQINGPVVPGDGAWHHVAVTKAGASVTFYIDGVGSATSYSVVFTFDGAAGGDFAIGTNPIYASQGNPPSTYALPGLVDEVEVFNRTLTATEVAAIYNAGRAGKCKGQLTGTGGTGTWSGWSAVPGGGQTGSQPAAVVDSTGTLHLYIQGVDNGLWVKQKTGGSWSGWSQVPGGGSLDGPAAVLDGTQVRLVVRGLDNRIWTTLTGGPQAAQWETLGGQTVNAPAAVQEGTTLHIFLRGIDGRLYMNSRSTGGTGTSTPITPGQSVSGSLTTTDRTSQRRTGAFADLYTFSGTAGQAVSLRLRGDFDTFVFLLGPDGSVIASNDDCPGDGRNSCLPTSAPSGGTLPLPSTGTYTIEVTSFLSGATGTYTLTLTLTGGGVTPPPPPPPTAPPCTYALTPTTQAFGAQGGPGSMTVRQRESVCTVQQWTAVSNAPWITAVSIFGLSNGNGNVSYFVSPNTGAPRQGMITVAGQNFTVIQSGASPFQGRIDGTWEGVCQLFVDPVSVSGTFFMEIDANGGVTGRFLGSESGTITGSITPGGVLSTVSGAGSGGVSWSGTFFTNPLRGGGAWRDSGFCSGTWSSF